MSSGKQSLFEYPEHNKPVTVGLRLKSMLWDHIIQCVFILPVFIPSMIAGYSRDHYEPGFTSAQYYLLAVSYAVYFCKDCIGGRSIAKRILGFQVADNRTGRIASPMQCFIRNLLIIIWPVEILVIFFSPARRLGDRLAGTKIVYFDSTKEEEKVNLFQIVLPFMLAFAISLLLMWALKRT